MTTDSSASAIDALESNLWSMWSQFGFGDGCRLIDDAGVTRFETPIGQAPYNTVVRFHVDDAPGRSAGDVVDGVLARYAELGVPLVWIVHPSARPVDLCELLGDRGLVVADVVPGMVCELDRLPSIGAAPDGIEVTELRPDDHGRYVELLRSRYDLPPAAGDTLLSIMHVNRFGQPGSRNRSWIAVRDGRAVSKASVHVDDGVAGIYGVATAPDARGLGLARTLTLHALTAARDGGARTAVLHSSPMAERLYAAIGFRRVADFTLMATPGALHL